MIGGGGGSPQQRLSVQRWADAVGIFNRPLAGVKVYQKFVWVFRGFIEMLIKTIFINLKILK